MDESFCNKRTLIISTEFSLIIHSLVVYNVYYVANGQPREMRERMSLELTK